MNKWACVGERHLPELDTIDCAILRALQRDAAATVNEVSQTVGISSTPCWKRIKRLEEAGVIEKRVALLNPDELGLNLVGYIRIRTNEHNEDWLAKFASGIKIIPEVMECHRMSGDVDYLIKIVVADMADYDRVYKKLISVAPMAEVSGNFSMERLKQTTELPL